MQTSPVSGLSNAVILARRTGMVLVVDDEPLMCEMIHRALSRAGFQSRVAASPAEAIDLARRHPIALLVTDLMISRKRCWRR